MLINALYLDESALENYVAALEGGLRDSGSSVSKGSRGFGGSLGMSAVKVDAQVGTESQDTLTLKDHAASRLQRLITAGNTQPEDVCWLEVLNPDSDFLDVGVGTFVHWECDVYIPDSIAALANRDGLANALRLFKGLAPTAKALGLNMSEGPSLEQVDAMVNFVDNVDVVPVVVGDDVDTEWKVVGALSRQWIRPGATFDDRVRIIGKIKKRITPNHWHPLLSLPGMNLVAREERRRMEREGPKDAAQESQFVHGPALVVDYLAIYT